jgi:beta-barrel assembly-enhancing protease
MKKVIIQLVLFIAIIFSTWFVLSRINWMSIFNVTRITKTTEEKLGETFWKLFSRTEKEICSSSVKNPVDSLVDHICKCNSIERSKIKLHILKNNKVNAFSLPNGYLVVFSGLIEASENEAELTGVLGHEIAHIEKDHVMKKLVKEVGLSVLISITSGNNSGQAAKEIVEKLSSTAFDRDLEREADISAVDYMIKADIDPEPFANFLFRLADEEKNIPRQVYWISTHPDSKERAENIIKYIKGKTLIKKQLLPNGKWEQIKSDLNDRN